MSSYSLFIIVSSHCALIHNLKRHGGRCRKLHGPSKFAFKAKIYGVPINNPALSLMMKHLAIGQRQKTPNISAFHRSPHGSLVYIGQHFVTTRVVHLPKRIETSLITISDRSGPNHRIGPVATAGSVSRLGRVPSMLHRYFFQ